MEQFFQIYANLDTRRLTDRSGASIALPTHFQGDKYKYRLGILGTRDGATDQIYPEITSLSASIGPRQAIPTGGLFKLTLTTIGAATNELSFDSDAESLLQALVALPESATYPPAEAYSPSAGIWLVRFNTSTAAPLLVASNALEPESFCRINAFNRGAEKWIEIRLIQAPIATTQAYDRTLPSPPSITRIRSGGTEDIGDIEILTSEIQALKVPIDFNGTYSLGIYGRRTSFLSRTSSADAIEAALNALYPDGPRFRVTNPQNNIAHIEFIGPFLGFAQDLMTVTPSSVNLGDLTFSLDLNSTQAQSAMRLFPSGVTTTFEVEMAILPDDAEMGDLGIPFTIFQEDVLLLPEQQWDGLAAALPIDWLRPPQPRDYIPFTLDQIITGQQHYVQPFGDATASVYVFDHDLNSEAITVSIRENASGGRLLRDNEYAVIVSSADSIEVTFADPVALNALAIVITTAGPVSAFQNHTHTIGQITGLREELDLLTASINALENLFPPGVSPLHSLTSATVIKFNEHAEALFFKGVIAPGALDLIKTLPVRGPFMLPAVHNATIIDPLPTPIPEASSGNAGTIWQSDRRIFISGGGRIRGSYIEDDEFVASDGRLIYPVLRDGSSISYFPRVFERELWAIAINDRMLPRNKRLTVSFTIVLQLFNASSRAQWELVIEKGVASDQVIGDPDTTAIDLLNVEWDVANPILSQRIILTQDAIPHAAGVRILRRVDDSLTCTRIIYGNEESANELAPATANFALRARLINFDTENSRPLARGWVVHQLIAADDGGSLGVSIS